MADTDVQRVQNKREPRDEGLHREVNLQTADQGHGDMVVDAIAEKIGEGQPALRIETGEVEGENRRTGGAGVAVGIKGYGPVDDGQADQGAERYLEVERVGRIRDNLGGDGEGGRIVEEEDRRRRNRKVRPEAEVERIGTADVDGAGAIGIDHGFQHAEEVDGRMTARQQADDAGEIEIEDERFGEGIGEKHVEEQGLVGILERDGDREAGREKTFNLVGEALQRPVRIVGEILEEFEERIGEVDHIANGSAEHRQRFVHHRRVFDQIDEKIAGVGDQQDDLLPAQIREIEEVIEILENDRRQGSSENIVVGDGDTRLAAGGEVECPEGYVDGKVRFERQEKVEVALRDRIEAAKIGNGDASEGIG